MNEEENELFKASYMQNPFGISSTDLDKLEKHCVDTMKRLPKESKGYEEHWITLRLIDTYKNQLALTFNLQGALHNCSKDVRSGLLALQIEHKKVNNAIEYIEKTFELEQDKCITKIYNILKGDEE